MKEWFKKGFGLITGIYAACALITAVDKFLPEVAKPEKSEKEES